MMPNPKPLLLQFVAQCEFGKTPVPIIYASPEKWKSISRGGFLRDAKGKIQLPAIAYQRTSMENSMIGTKVDVNNPLVQSYQKPYSSKNRYDNFINKFLREKNNNSEHVEFKAQLIIDKIINHH